MNDTLAQLIDANRKLVISNRDLKMFFELSIDLLAVADQYGVFIQLSKSWEDATGYTREELMSKPFVYFVATEDLQTTVNEDVAIQNGKTAIDFVNRYKKKDGGFVTLQWRSHSVDGMTYAIARVID